MRFAFAVALSMLAWAEPAGMPPGLDAGLRMPPIIQLAPPSARELNAPNPKPGVRRIGIHRRVSANVVAKGRWSKLPDGSRIWRAGIRSPGARALRVHFKCFVDGTLWVHNGSKNETGGPYLPSSMGEDFWSDTLPGSLIVIEFRGTAPPTFQIPEVSHHFATIASLRSY